MHGFPWAEAKATYEPLLVHVVDRQGLQDVVNMMVGELNASHMGIRGGRSLGSHEPQTRFPGFEIEADACGNYRVKHIYKSGPADKEYIRMHVGDYLLAIDNHVIESGENYWRWYALPANWHVELTLNSKPVMENSWRVRIIPVGSFEQETLQYEKWVDDRRAWVEKRANGEIGYLHKRFMNNASLGRFKRDLVKMRAKKALIIDQRFNPGGDIDQELLQILQQRQYQYVRSRGSVAVSRPAHGFFGPLVVMMNEASTSDAEVFPDGFRTLRLGKLVGMTTPGAVIGTPSYELMENMTGTNLESYGIAPDVRVDNSPEDFLKDQDAQLEKAVEVLQQEFRNAGRINASGR
jgi:tricorn protease